MENIETLLAAVVQTQGLEDDGPAVKTGVELGPENSEAPSVDVPAPARALAPAAGQVIDAAVDKKKKRGWPKGQTRAKPPPRKRIKPENEEDVCFICFDGGSLVLCDRKGCPKAYHPACIKRDEAFFQSKAKWNCGWHICSVCRKTSHYLCYTCTYSLCKGCTKDADYVCVRGNKGFCTICMKTIMLIENKDQANTESVDFDDQTSWEYLFKVYWVILKEKFSLTLDELIRAKNPCKSVPAETALPSTGFDVKKTDNDDIIGVITPRHDKDTPKPTAYEINNETSIGKDSEWATKDLLEFVSLVKKGEKSVISQFDLQTLLLDYIKKNNLRDPHRKSQIVCDQRLRNLFGKPRVGHIEMLKLLEHHSILPGLVSSRTISRKRKTSKKCEERAPQQNNDSNEYYAAIDVHNINLIYLRRNVLEKLIDDRERFGSKVIGSIVRIKLSSDDQKLEVLHRLVQVVGTSKVLGEPYKVGSRTTDFMLEVLNLDKKEFVSIDAVSNQEFTEVECKRLRQSMKCGLVKHFTVGEIRNKAMALQPVRVGDMLKSPEERSRRISEIPEVHLDPKMNLNYESEKDTKSGGVSKADENVRPIDSDLPPQNGKKKPISSNKKDKEERIVGTRNRVRKKIKSGESSCIKKDQALQSSVLETSPAIASVENSQPTSIIETENLWHYRDPNSKIQGPFSMIQLRKWSTTGLFPPDMRIWTNHEQYDSLLLTDCLAGKFHLASDTSHSGTQNEEEVPAEEIRVLSEGTNVNSGDSNQTKPGLASNTGLTSKKNAEPVKEDASGSWPQCWDLLKDDDNDHNNNNNNDDDDARACDLLPSSSPEKIHLAPANLCQESESENGEKSEIGPLENPIIPMQNLESQSKNEECAHVPSESGPINKHNPPKPAKIEPLPVEIQVPIHNFEILELLSPTPRSNNENPEFMNFPDSNPAQMWSNPSGPGLGGEIRLPGFEDSGGPDPAPAPAPSNSNWLTISETIEFDSLGEEYVSDLLAEVDAMESQQHGTRLPSPTAAIKFARELMEDCRDDDDCFSSIEEFSRQSSAWSSTGGEEAPAKPAVSMFDFLTRSSVHSSVGSEGGEITTNKVDNNNNDVVGLSGLDGVQGNINLVTVQGNVNLVLGGPTGLGGWGGTGQGTGWVGPTSMNAASPRDGSQRKYGGGYVRGRLPWGGAYNNTPTRPMHKGGQRVCKFYESGHCKKGAFCDYLHP